MQLQDQRPGAIEQPDCTWPTMQRQIMQRGAGLMMKASNGTGPGVLVRIHCVSTHD